jgi:hypothetical protein
LDAGDGRDDTHRDAAERPQPAITVRALVLGALTIAAVFVI